MTPVKKKQDDPAKTALKLAQKLLRKKGGSLEELRAHHFKDEESAEDEELAEQLYDKFSADVARVQEELSKIYGKPLHTGKKDSKHIPLNGVFRYAYWEVGGKPLFVAAHHEDVGITIILWLGTIGEDCA